jgi:hypothetical protein
MVNLEQMKRLEICFWFQYEFCGVIIAWKSKASNCVTLSSTEAYYGLLSKATK